MSTRVGLRERQKARRRSDILTAARALFSAHGYTGASMEAIAESAEVGVATVYNYFGSKGRLLADLLRPDFDDMFARADAMIADPDPNPVESVLSLVNEYHALVQAWERRDVLAAVIGPGLSAEPVLDALTSEVEARVVTQIEALLATLQRAEKVRPSIDVRDAAKIAFYLFNQHFIEYVTHERITIDAMKDECSRHLIFIIEAITE